MHGPCDTELEELGEQTICPHFGDGMTLDGRIRIRVVDDMARTLRLRKRRTWRKVRAAALAEWEQAGLKFVVEEGSGESYSKADYGGPGYYISPFAIPKAIRLIRNRDNTFTDMAAYNRQVDGSVAAFAPEADLGYYQYVIVHEVGHCLGLNHRRIAVMAGQRHPDQHDLDSVRAYYHAL